MTKQVALRSFMSSKFKLKLSKRLYKQLLAADVAIVKPQTDSDCAVVMHPAIHYRRYVSENQQAIGYVAYQGWQSQGRGLIALTPLWEQEYPELALVYVSIDNLLRLPLLAMALTRTDIPHWYVSLAQSVRSQLMTRLDTYDPHTEAVILGQVEDITQIYPDDQVYEQIQRIEIFTYCEFEPSLPDCYAQFKGRACEFSVYE